jgi:phage shock protein E
MTLSGGRLTLKPAFIRILLAVILLSCCLPLRSETADEAVWIDVRTPTEYASGHLLQARLIPFDGIEAGVAALQLDKDTPIYLYCAVGGRAEVAKQRLQARGFSKVTNAGSLENARRLYAESQKEGPEGTGRGQ